MTDALPKLTDVQARFLAKICATNGGGIRMNCKVSDGGEVIPCNMVYRKLWELDLIQGKSGAYETVVHTALGWRVYALFLKGDET